MSQAKGTLYLVATPIGNLEDITRRALRVLAEVEVVACEDTRRTRALLEHFGIRAKTVSYHEHNERERAAELAALLERGAAVAVVSDAGTPGINDPGYRIVCAAAERGINVVPVPGPSARRGCRRTSSTSAASFPRARTRDGRSSPPCATSEPRSSSTKRRTASRSRSPTRAKSSASARPRSRAS